jgi:hypothetical protein
MSLPMPIAVWNRLTGLEINKGKTENLMYNNIMNLNCVTMHKTDKILTTSFSP